MGELRHFPPLSAAYDPWYETARAVSHFAVRGGVYSVSGLAVKADEITTGNWITSRFEVAGSNRLLAENAPTAMQLVGVGAKATALNTSVVNPLTGQLNPPCQYDFWAKYFAGFESGSLTYFEDAELVADQVRLFSGGNYNVSDFYPVLFSNAASTFGFLPSDFAALQSPHVMTDRIRGIYLIGLTKSNSNLTKPDTIYTWQLVNDAGLKSVTCMRGKIFAATEHDLFLYTMSPSGAMTKTRVFTTRTPNFLTNPPLKIISVRWFTPYNLLLIELYNTDPLIEVGKCIVAFDTTLNQLTFQSFGSTTAIDFDGLKIVNVFGDAVFGGGSTPRTDFGYPTRPSLYIQTALEGENEIRLTTATGSSVLVNAPTTVVTVGNSTLYLGIGSRYTADGCGSDQIIDVELEQPYLGGSNYSISANPIINGTTQGPGDPLLTAGPNMFHQVCPRAFPVDNIQITNFFDNTYDPADRIQLAQLSIVSNDWWTPAENNTNPRPLVLMETWDEATQSFVSKLWPGLPDADDSEFYNNLVAKRAYAGVATPSFNPADPLVSNLGTTKITDIGVDKTGSLLVMSYSYGELVYLAGPHLPRFDKRVQTATAANNLQNSVQYFRSLAVVPNAEMFASQLATLVDTTALGWPQDVGQVEDLLSCGNRIYWDPDLPRLTGHLPMTGEANLWSTEDSGMYSLEREGEHVVNLFWPFADNGQSVYTARRPTVVMIRVDVTYDWDPAVDGLIGTAPDIFIRFGEFVAPNGWNTSPIHERVLLERPFGQAGSKMCGGTVTSSTVMFINFEPDGYLSFQCRMSGDADLFDRYKTKYTIQAVDTTTNATGIVRAASVGGNIGKQTLIDPWVSPGPTGSALAPTGTTNPSKALFLCALSVNLPSLVALGGVRNFEAQVVLTGNPGAIELARVPIDMRIENVGNTGPLRLCTIVPLVVPLTTDTYTSYSFDVVIARDTGGETVTSTWEAELFFWDFQNVGGGTPQATTAPTLMVRPDLENAAGYNFADVAISNTNCGNLAALFFVPSASTDGGFINWGTSGGTPANNFAGMSIVNSNSGLATFNLPVTALSGRWSTPIKKNLRISADSPYVGFYRVRPAIYHSVTTTAASTTAGPTTTTVGAWTGAWVYVACVDSIRSYTDVEVASLALNPTEDGMCVCVADGPAIYFATLTPDGLTARIYKAPLDLSSSTLVDTIAGGKITDLAWDWEQQVLVAQDAGHKRIRKYNSADQQMDPAADVSCWPYIGDIPEFVRMEVGPKSILYTGAYWSINREVYEPITPNSGQPLSALARPSYIDVSKSINSADPDADSGNTFVHRLFQTLIESQSPVGNEFSCRVEPYASAFRPLRDLQPLTSSTGTSTTTGGGTTATLPSSTGGSTTGSGSTTSGSSTSGGSTTVDTGSTTTGGSTTGGSTTGGTATLTVPTSTSASTTLGSTTGDPGCWEISDPQFVEIYPAAGAVIIRRQLTSTQYITQLVPNCPATQLVFSATLDFVANATWMYIADAGGTIVARLLITTPGRYRLKYTPTAVGALRVGIMVPSGSPDFTQFHNASLRACDE